MAPVSPPTRRPSSTAFWNPDFGGLPEAVLFSRADFFLRRSRRERDRLRE